jgi:hypothetical protein
MLGAVQHDGDESGGDNGDGGDDRGDVAWPLRPIQLNKALRLQP